MYIPASFVEDDLHKLHDFVIANSFATLVSSGRRESENDEPFASHLPLLCDRSTGPQGRLIGHLAAANPHWHDLDGSQALAIFTGPHAYISPTWMDTANAVPTWNYVAVHVYGTVRLERDPQRLKGIVQAYVDFYEASLPEPWRLESADADFIDGLLKAIVGFTMDIERIEGKRKLSQNHSPQRRQSVIRNLLAAGGPDRERIAELMAETIQP